MSLPLFQLGLFVYPALCVLLFLSPPLSPPLLCPLCFLPFCCLSLSIASSLPISFPSCPSCSLESGAAGDPERQPEASWGPGVMVHVLLCTDRQAQDRSFHQSRPHNPSLKHRNRQGNHWHARHSTDEGQRGVGPIHPLTISQGWSHWYNTSQHTDTTRAATRHTHDDPLAPVAQD